MLFSLKLIRNLSIYLKLMPYKGEVYYYTFIIIIVPHCTYFIKSIIFVLIFLILDTKIVFQKVFNMCVWWKIILWCCKLCRNLISVYMYVKNVCMCLVCMWCIAVYFTWYREYSFILDMLRRLKSSSYF